MNLHRTTTALIIASLAAVPAGRAAAGSDALGGFAVGAIVGGLIGNQMGKNTERQRQQQQRVYRQPVAKPQMSQATRNANVEAQTALNYFGFPVGAPDGVMGRQSRAAVSQYQALLGYPATGELSLYERDFLVNSYHRAVAGGAGTMQMIAANPMGPRGLLIAYRDQMAGTPPAMALAPAQMAPMVPVPMTPAAPAPAPVEAAAPAPAPAVPAPVPMAAAAALPSFLAGQGGMAGGSLASHCNKVGLQTSTNGGFAKAAADPALLIDEQFCLARTYAITEGEDLAARIPGATPQTVAEQCAGFGPAMKEIITAVSLQPEDKVLPEVADFAVSTGMTPADLAVSAKICLSSGYRTDDMGVAIGSALLLAAMGQKGYGELIGHHLARAFGTAKRPDLAMDWYEGALAQPSDAVFARGQPDRGAMILKAAATLSGRAPAAAAPVPAAVPMFTAPAPVTKTP